MGEIIRIDVTTPKRVLTMELDCAQAGELIQALLSTTKEEKAFASAASLMRALATIRDNQPLTGAWGA